MANAQIGFCLSVYVGNFMSGFCARFERPEFADRRMQSVLPQRRHSGLIQGVSRILKKLVFRRNSAGAVGLRFCLSDLNGFVD